MSCPLLSKIFDETSILIGADDGDRLSRLREDLQLARRQLLLWRIVEPHQPQSDDGDDEEALKETVSALEPEDAVFESIH